MDNNKSLQSYFTGNLCFGCGHFNPFGLRLETFLTGPGTTISKWMARPHFISGLLNALHGGTSGTLVDCPLIWTATADEYAREGREFGDTPLIWFVTRKMTVEFLKPTPMDTKLTIEAAMDREYKDKNPNRRRVTAALFGNGVKCVTSELIASKIELSPQDTVRLTMPPAKEVLLEMFTSEIQYAMTSFSNFSPRVLHAE